MGKKIKTYQITASNNRGQRRVVAIRDTKEEAERKVKEIKSIRPSARSGIGTKNVRIKKAMRFK